MGEKLIVLDPGHGGSSGKDKFRKGPSGEREEWINLRVARSIEKHLLLKKYKVILTRTEDVEVELSERVKLGVTADLFLSVHHNSADPVDPKLNYPSVFVHGPVSSQNCSLNFAQCLAQQFSLEKKAKAYIFSDKLIFEDGLYVLREMKASVPAVISEFSFFSEPFEEARLKQEDYCDQVALCYVQAIETYFSSKSSLANEKNEIEAVFFDEAYRQELKSIRAQLLLDKDSLSAVAYSLSAQHHFNLGNIEFAGKEVDRSLALLINGPYMKSILELGLIIADKLGNQSKKLVLERLLSGAIIEISAFEA